MSSDSIKKREAARLPRREFLRWSSLGLAASASRAYSPVVNDSVEFPLLITNARSWIQGEWRTIQIGVTKDGRIKLGPRQMTGGEVIDARGKILSPGFVDVLADGTTSTGSAYRIFEKYKVADGVTTALQMHGGADDIGGYYDSHKDLPHRVNFGVSTKVMAIRYRFHSIQDRLRHVEKCLDEGGLGVSHSIEYQPTPWDELVDFARLAEKYQRPLFLHLRYSSQEKELDGIREAIRLAEVTGARVHMDHLHSTGGTFNMEVALSLISSAVDRGHRVTIGVYPYTYWATYLHSRRFDEGWQERYGLTYNDLQIVGTGERLTEKSFRKYRAVRGLLVAVPPGTMPSEKTIDLALREPFCLVGSDGGILSEPRANNHPRGAGCFATAMRHGLSIGLSLEEMIRKMTELPRQVLAPMLEDRGILADGARADLTIFDPEKIDGRATIDDPNQFSAGIEAVIVNGAVAYRDGTLLKEAGHPVRAELREVRPQASMS